MKWIRTWDEDPKESGWYPVICECAADRDLCSSGAEYWNGKRFSFLDCRDDVVAFGDKCDSQESARNLAKIHVKEFVDFTVSD